MSTLLLHIRGYFLYNKTLFPPNLFIYDDFVVYKKRSWFFFVEEITISYNQIAQVVIKSGIVFSHLGIMSTGVENIHIRYLFKWRARQAKKIIDQKVFHSHGKRGSGSKSTKSKNAVRKYERSLSRLRELLHKGRITKREYNKKRKQLLNKLR